MEEITTRNHKKNCYLHIGMHKTGSTSIQNSLVSLNHPDFHYFKGGANHGVLLSLAFGDPLTHTSVRRGLNTPEEAQAKSAKHREQFLQQLQTHKNRHLIISGEDLSIPQNFQVFKQVVRLIRPTHHVRTIAYVRDPWSLAASSFQQQCKGYTKVSLNYATLKPDYKSRFEAIEAFVADETICYKNFSKKTLFKGDVVLDFAHHLNIPPACFTYQRSNDSLSKEATCLLYAFKNSDIYRTARKDKRSSRTMKAMIRALQTIGDSKLILGPEHWNAKNAKFMDELAWIEARIGMRFEHSIHASSGVPIQSEQQIFETAEHNAALIDPLITGPAGPLNTLTDRLHALWEQTHHALNAAAQPRATSREKG